MWKKCHLCGKTFLEDHGASNTPNVCPWTIYYNFFDRTHKYKGNLVANGSLQYPGRSSTWVTRWEGAASLPGVAQMFQVMSSWDAILTDFTWLQCAIESSHTNEWCHLIVLSVCTHWATHTVTDLTHNGLILCGEQTGKGVFLQPFIWPRGPVGTQRAPLNSQHETGWTLQYRL